MTAMNPQLKATESNWRLFMIRKADPAFLPFQKAINKRDNHTCQFCGFRSSQLLEVINRDGNYHNNKRDNLVTACDFCAQCFFLDSIGKGEFGGATLIYLPELTQSHLNAFCHILFSSIISGTEYASQARSIYRSFRLRSQLVERQLGEGLSNPSLFGQLLVEAGIRELTDISDALQQGLRLLPDLVRFAPLVEKWVRSGLEELVFE